MLNNKTEEQIRVLLVDDEESFGSVLVERLRLRGYEADYVYSAVGAIESVKNTPYDVILLDLKMPGLDGISVFEKIKAINPAIEIIIISGRLDVDNVNKEVIDSAFDYLVKPLNINEVIHK
ncbi:MAG: response regulator, partial [Candidatus Magnetoovum sp. WYHC-5]|nr:response regulator [Candidatus Magnetoovum sp. WYHC-5]